MINEENATKSLESHHELERLKRLKELDEKQKKTTMFVLTETGTQKKALYRQIAEISGIAAVDHCIDNSCNLLITIKSENPLSIINSVEKISKIEDVKEFTLYSSIENNPMATETVMKEAKRNPKCRNNNY